MSAATRNSTKDSWTATLDYILGKKRAEEALGFLTTCGRHVASATSFAEAAASAVDLAVPFLADWVEIRLSGESAPVFGSRGDVTRFHEYQNLATSLNRVRDDDVSPIVLSVLARALRHGEEETVADVTLLAEAEAADVASVVTLPMVAHGSSWGTVAAVRVVARRDPNIGRATLLMLIDLSLRLAAAAEIFAARNATSASVTGEAG